MVFSLAILMWVGNVQWEYKKQQRVETCKNVRVVARSVTLGNFSDCTGVMTV